MRMYLTRLQFHLGLSYKRQTTIGTSDHDAISDTPLTPPGPAASAL